MRRLSFVLLTIEAVVLVFPTFMGFMLLLGTSGLAWNGLWSGSDIAGAFVWIALLLSLVSAWWLLISYFYTGAQGARRVPVPIWIFAALVALLASVGVFVRGEDSPLRGLAVGFLFVPTFLHLVGEVWVWRPKISLERAREK